MLSSMPAWAPKEENSATKAPWPFDCRDLVDSLQKVILISLTILLFIFMYPRYHFSSSTRQKGLPDEISEES